MLNKPSETEEQKVYTDLTALWWLMAIPGLGVIAMVVFLVLKLKK